MADRKLQVVITGDASSLNRAFGQAQSATERLGTNLATAGRKMTRNLTLPILAAGAAAAKTAIDFESAFTGVTKTVDGTDRQLSKIRSGIRQMAKEIPATTAEISAIAEAAGALGIETDSILGFTRVMVDLGETTDLTADQAATSLARIANVMGTSHKEFDRMAATIVDLGNNGASTESEITEMAQRIAAAGKIAGIAESDLLGIASALANVGVKAESGGTAAQKVLNGLSESVATSNEDLKTFAETAGMSAQEFKTAWEDDAATAFAAFVSGLGDAGDGAFQILRDLGLANERTITAFLSLAASGDNLTDSLETGQRAWRENIAHTKEAEKRYKTTASGLEILRNNVADLAISMSETLLPAVQSVVKHVSRAVKWFSNLEAGTKKTILIVGGLVAALGPLVFIIGKAILAVKGVGVALTFLAAHPVVLAAAGIAALVTGLVVAYKKSAAFREIVDRVGAALKNLWDAIQPLIPALGTDLTGAMGQIGPIMNNVALPALRAYTHLLTTIIGLISQAIGAIGSFRAAMAEVNIPATPIGVVRNLLDGRAHGGNVTGGTPYIVGERGPELFVPSRSGSIKPNHELRGGGGDTYNIYTDGTQDGRKVALMIRQELENDRRHNARHDRTRGN